MEGKVADYREQFIGPSEDIENWISIVTAPNRETEIMMPLISSKASKEQDKIIGNQLSSFQSLFRIRILKDQLKNKKFYKYGKLGKRTKRKTRKRIT